MFLKIPLERLSLLCHNVATCLSAGLGVPASLRASVRSSSAGPLRGIVEAAAESTASGTELSEALEPNRDRFPRFFVPVIRCGEQSGRLDEAFRYLAQHCHLMARPSSLARNIWLLPLAILVGFSLVGLVITAVVAPIWVALAHAGQELGRYAVLAAVVAVVLFVPEVRAVVDRVKLAIPVVGAIERDLAVNRFFHALHLVYATGGMRVEAMIRLAMMSVASTAIIPMQDVLGLDGSARMNKPAGKGGWWCWRLLPGQTDRRLERWLRELSETYGRI